MSELVTIVMPVKNAMPYLTHCLESIQAQSYPHWELLAVNDHSTDTSNQELINFSANDKRIQVLQNDGNGIIHALRTAKKHAKGTYITRMDADDVMAENKLKNLHLVLQNKEIQVATGWVNYFAANGVGIGYIMYEEWLNGLCSSLTHYNEMYKECVIPSPCWMMRMADFDRIGGFEEERYPEDYDLVFRMYEHQMKVGAVEEILHYWRDYGARTSRNDPHYSDNSFLDIKLHYFLKLDYEPSKQLVLWGAGKKGKWLAKELKSLEIPFRWLCDNPNKIGKEIYGCLMENANQFHEIQHPQTIVVVANQMEQRDIAAVVKGTPAFFFA